MKKQKIQFIILNSLIIVLVAGIVYRGWFTFTKSLITAQAYRQTSDIIFVQNNADNIAALESFISKQKLFQKRNIFSDAQIQALEHIITYYQKQKNAQACLSWTYRLLSLWNQNFEYYRDLGNCYLLDHDRKNAFDAFYTAWKIKPTDKNTTEALLRIARIDNMSDMYNHILHTYQTYPTSHASIQVFLNDSKYQTAPLSLFEKREIDYSTTTKQITLAPKQDSDNDLINPPEYITISFSEHQGSGSIFQLQSLTLVLENKEKIVFDRFSDWQNTNINQLDQTDMFQIQSMFASMQSPKLSLDSPITEMYMTIALYPITPIDEEAL